MNRSAERGRGGAARLFLFPFAAVLMIGAAGAAAQDVPAVPAVETEYMQLATASYEDWVRLDLSSAEAKAMQVVSSPHSEDAARVEAFKTLVLVHLSNDKMDRARQALTRMLEIDPASRFSPEGFYTKDVINLYHAVHDSLQAGVMDIHTIAVGDFENNSIYVGKFKKRYDFNIFKTALVHTVVTDLSACTKLKIVDRQRTEKIIEETQLVSAGIVDPASAVRAGKMLGAHCFIFGQYMMLDKKNVRIDLRVVHTATGEIIVAKQITGEFGGKPEKFLELEKELVVEIAAAVDSVVSEMTGAASFLSEQAEEYFTAQSDEVKGRKNYNEAQFLIGSAMEKEQQDDYAAALEDYEKALDIDPENRDAKRRVLILRSHVMAG